MADTSKFGLPCSAYDCVLCIAEGKKKKRKNRNRRHGVRARMYTAKNIDDMFTQCSIALYVDTTTSAATARDAYTDILLYVFTL